MKRRTDGTKGAPGRGILGGVLATLVALAVPAIACSGSNGNGLGGGSALCGVNGSTQCPGNEQCSAALGCVECISDSDCAEPNPVCILGTGQCGACSPGTSSNNGCPMSAPSCWPGDAQCHMACMVDSDCPNDLPICEAASGACVGCTMSSQCSGMTSVCNTTTQNCVECATKADCPTADPLCQPAKSTCVQCLSNSDCGVAKPICQPGRYVCVVGCTTDAQCSGATPVCNTTTAGCVECGVNADCASQTGKFCDPDGSCVGCLANSDCSGSTPICSSESCVQCAKSSDCTANQICLGGNCVL
jgi:hypothetical protein